MASRPHPHGQRGAPLARAVVSRTRFRLEIETYDPSDAILVVSETMYPGWKARIDGQPTPVHYADYAMRGVAVPLGSHRVEMWFVPPWGRAGEALTLVGLALVAAIAGQSLVRRSRHSPAPNRS